METLLLAGLVVFVAVVLFRALFPSSQPPQPQIIYVQAEPARSGRVGCVPLLIVGIILLVVLVGV